MLVKRLARDACTELRKEKEKKMEPLVHVRSPWKCVWRG